MQFIQTLLVAIFPALVIIAALKDVTSFRIPNWLSGALVLTFFPAALASGMELSVFGIHMAVGFGGLVAGMIMFALGWIGGGDAKLLAGVALWLGLPAVAPFLLITALAGGALALFLFNIRGNIGRALIPAGPPWIERLRDPKGDAPYGVAIAVGALAAFPQCALVVVGAG
jgi:prepilin peptidase CpaA